MKTYNITLRETHVFDKVFLVMAMNQKDAIKKASQMHKEFKLPQSVKMHKQTVVVVK